MLPLTTCDRCEGKGTKVETNFGPASRSDDPSSIKTCSSCNGFGVRKKSYGAYKDRATAERYRNRGAITCSFCRGESKVGSVQVTRACYDCGGLGKTPMFDPDVDPVVPPEYQQTTATVSKAFLDAWKKAAVPLVIRQDRGATWGEANLGMTGALWTSIDYGDMAKLDDEAIVHKVMDDISDARNRPQLCKLMDPKTRRVGTVLAIVVTRNSYAPIVADIAHVRPMLPPTYTDDVLNRPWNR